MEDSPSPSATNTATQTGASTACHTQQPGSYRKGKQIQQGYTNQQLHQNQVKKSGALSKIEDPKLFRFPVLVSGVTGALSCQVISEISDLG